MFETAWNPELRHHGIQWWYFTLLCTSGAVYAGRLWVSGDPDRRLTSGVDLYANPAGAPGWEVHRHHADEAFYARCDRVEVMVEGSSLVHEGSTLKLRIRCGDLMLEAEGEPLQTTETPTIRHPLGGGNRFIWTVPMLEGRFTGRLTRPGRPVEVLAGTMFHDHVVADVKPSLDLLLNYRGWCWGLIYLEDWSALFLNVSFSRAPLGRAIVAVNGAPPRVEPGPVPVRWRDGDPPRFEVVRGGRVLPVELTALHQRRQVTQHGRVYDMATHALLRPRKLHGAGTVAAGRFYFEQMTFFNWR